MSGEHKIKAMEMFPYEASTLVSEASFIQAERNGWIVSVPDKRTLQLDIDSDESFEMFKKRMERMESAFDVEDVFIEPSKSGGQHKHIRVVMTREMDHVNKAFLQLYLGSDSTREFLSFLRIQINDPTPHLLFEKR